MSSVTVIWSMIAAASLTLAAIYLLVWLRGRDNWPALLFALTAVSTAAFTFCELWMMQAQTPAAYDTALRWSHVPLFAWFVSITWFVRLRLRAGRLWLAWTACGLRAVALLLNFLMTSNINFRQITGLVHIEFLGSTVAVAEGVPNPLMLIGQAGVVLLIALVVDASITAWRRGDRRSALLVGAGVSVFLVAALGTALLVLWGFATLPFAFGAYYLGMLAVMAYELSNDLLRSTQLARELQTSEAARNVLREELALAGRVSMMGQLASGLAHEINQPLASIQRNAEAAELYLKQAAPDLEEIRAILVDIRKDDERAGQVISRMRALLRRHTIKVHPLVAGTLIAEVATLVHMDAMAKHVALSIDVPADTPAVLGDRVHVQQVLLNLVLNAMDALASVSPIRRRISITARLDGARHVEIAVGDAGPGIPGDLLPRIFDPFFTTKPEGMGMGLAISRTIIEAHGGRLWAGNNPGGGAIFRMTLPVAEMEATK